MSEQAGPPDPPERAGSRGDDDLYALAQSDAVAPLETLTPSTDRLARRDKAQDIELKRTYARWLLILMAAQLLVADAVFVVYAWAGVDWKLTPGVINVWLGATFVEVVGIVLVVTRYLFPRRDA